MLAGRMKLNHFLLIVALALGALAAVAFATGALGLFVMSTDDPPAAPVEHPLDPTPAKVAVPAPADPVDVAVAKPPADAVALDSLRPDERFVLGWQGKPLGSAKRKDAKKGGAWKVNLYQDDGHATVNRAKVDLDRDDRWDQKYTFEADGSVTRKTSTGDDGTYDVNERWTGTEWGPA